MTAKTTTWIAALAAAAALAGGGYWLGRASAPHPVAEPAAGAAPEPGQRRILYYRNPMGLPDTSPVPKKDPMGMDYIPVYEGEAAPAAASGIAVSAERVQRLGVRTARVEERTLARRVLAAGVVEANERGLAAIAPKFEGWIETLHVNTTGQAVRRGQPVAEVYSPELAAAQREYLIAKSGARALERAGGEAAQGARELADSAAQRLRNWDLTPAQIERLAAEGQPRRTVTLVSPVSGVVIEKPAVQGMRFAAGETLLRIADLSTVWLIAEVYEQDLRWVRIGQSASVSFNAYPERSFRGKVSFIYPTLRPETRTVRLRIDLPNPDGALKPAMYGTVELAAGQQEKVLAVPDSAVIDSGARQVVLVAQGEGRYAPREVKIGLRADGYAEVREGVKAGEEVVTRANFLIDAESNLKAALGAFEGGSSAAAAKPVHQAQAKVHGVDAGANAVVVDHGPIESLQWPAMRMRFVVADPRLMPLFKPGAQLQIELSEQAPGDYAITAARPAGGHAGH